MLEVKDLTLRTGAFQVKQVSFAVAEGSCHVLLGPTGSGKTLLLESVAGLRRPQAGTIHLAGQEISGTVPEKRKIAYLPQDLALFPTMTVKDNIAYSLRLSGLAKRERYAKIRDLASGLGIAEILDRHIYHLSGGEKQRVALARALAAGSKMMLFDEPLSSLHTSLRREVCYLLQEIRQEHKLTYLMVTHDLEEALFLGDTISIIYGGRLLQTGDKEEVFNHPHSLEVARIVGVENFFRAVVKEVEEGRLLLHCAALDASFNVEKGGMGRLFRENDGVTLGIRANNIILTEPREQPGETNTTCFMVEGVYAKGSSATILLRHADSRETIAVAELSKHSYRAAPGHKVKVLFPGEDLMVFSSDVATEA
ncbi:MAG: ABC transporter ATP-binding protein [Bacillota bacterium]